MTTDAKKQQQIQKKEQQHQLRISKYICKFKGIITTTEAWMAIKQGPSKIKTTTATKIMTIILTANAIEEYYN